MENSKKDSIIKFVKATIISLVITLALILIFAFILKWTGASDAIIVPVNLAIKTISIIVGTVVFVKNGAKGFIKGTVLGASFAILTFVIFSILNASFNFGVGVFADIAFGAVVGAITGAVVVNLKKA